MNIFKKQLPGILLCLLIALLAPRLAFYVPGLGSTTISILLGLVLGNLLIRFSLFSPGAVFAEKKLLPLAIALLGVQLRIPDLLAVGLPAVALILITIPMAIFLGLVIGRLVGLTPMQSLLLGSGNAICGSSAIASVGRVVQAEEKDLGLTIAAVNFMGTLGLFLLPPLAVFLGLSPRESSGLLGASLQAVGHVVASGFGMSEEIGTVAVLIKMGRVLMLGPAVIIIGALHRKRRFSSHTNDPFGTPAGKSGFPVPLFILGFFAASLVVSYLPVPPALTDFVKRSGKFLLNTAMAGVGMKILFRVLVKQGPRIILAELISGSIQIAALLGLAVLFL